MPHLCPGKWLPYTTPLNANTPALAPLRQVSGIPVLYLGIHPILLHLSLRRWADVYKMLIPPNFPE